MRYICVNLRYLRHLRAFEKATLKKINHIFQMYSM